MTIDSKDNAEEALDDDKMRIINLDEYLDQPIFEISNSDEEKGHSTSSKISVWRHGISL